MTIAPPSRTSSCSPAASRTNATSRCAPAAGSPTASLEHGIEVELRDPDASLLGYLRDNRPDVVWPALHGASGEDGALRGLLEFLGIPFVGSRSESARLAWDKPTAKALVARAGVATPRSITLPRDAFRELGADAVLRRHPRRAAAAARREARPGRLGAGRDDRRGCRRPAARHGRRVHLQRRRDHRAADHAAPRSPSASSTPARARWRCPPSRSSRCRASTASRRGTTRARRGSTRPPGSRTRSPHAPPRTALTAHAALGLRHISRVDLIVDGAGTPWFLEANVLPGPHRDLARAAGARGRRARPRLGLREAGRSRAIARVARERRARATRSSVSRPAGRGCG